MTLKRKTLVVTHSKQSDKYLPKIGSGRGKKGKKKKINPLLKDRQTNKLTVSGHPFRVKLLLP